MSPDRMVFVALLVLETMLIMRTTRIHSYHLKRRRSGIGTSFRREQTLTLVLGTIIARFPAILAVVIPIVAQPYLILRLAKET
jgi:hypothetical protein